MTIKTDAISGILLSGGLDSAILLARMLDGGHIVQPFYIDSGLYWQHAELQAAQRYVAHFQGKSVRPVIVLEMPLHDLYRDHWSMLGRHVPDAETPDDAVYLPGRNLLLITKAALWCQLHGIATLALAPLLGNPFADATDEFFTLLAAALNHCCPNRISIERPFAHLSKQQVMALGKNDPLELTFSCLAPVGELHCGACNKCAERRQAFRDAHIRDSTRYAK